MTKPTRRAVFLDRDKTIIEDPGYINDPEMVHLLRGAGEAVRMLKQAGYLVVIVTNQSGVARGMVSEERLAEIHDRLLAELGACGAAVDKIYYCPYHPEGIIEPFVRESDLRKPAPGMLLLAAKELGIDLHDSWLVGDSARDIEAGQRAGCRTIRLTHGGETGDDEPQADITVNDILAAAELIVRFPSLREQKNSADGQS